MYRPKYNLKTTSNQRSVIESQPPGTRLFGALHGMPVIRTETGELWAITPRNHPRHGSLLRVTRISNKVRSARFAYRPASARRVLEAQGA